MEFLDLFSGIGGFRRGLERSGHRCIGHVEIDKYANISYMGLFLAVLFQTAYAKKEDKGFAMAPYLALGCLLAMLPA